MSFLDFFRKNKQKTNTIASLHTSTSSDDSKDIKSENNVEHIDDNERKIAREKNNFYKAVFLDRYSTGVHIMSDTEYPRYFYYDFGIKSPSSFHKKLIREGYYSPSEISDILESMRISDLKIVLKNLNTTTTGKKSELINRIFNSTSSDHLMLVLQSDGTEFYSLSDKGKKFVKKHADYILLFKHRDKLHIEFEDYISAKKFLPGTNNFYFVIQSILKDQEFENWKNNNYGSLAFAYQNMGDISSEISNSEETLIYYLKALYLQIVSANYQNLLLYKEGVYSKYDCKKGFIKPYLSYLVMKIYELREFYSQDVLDAAYKVFDHYFEFVLCDKETFGCLIKDIANNDFDNGQWINKFAEIYLNIFTNL